MIGSTPFEDLERGDAFVGEELTVTHADRQAAGITATDDLVDNDMIADALAESDADDGDDWGGW